MSDVADGRIVVVGARGMLGRAWQSLLSARQRDHLALDLPEFDLTERDQVAERIDDRVPLVVNCAAYTDVDAAETDEVAATRINGTGAGILAERCAAVGSTLLHYSTDYVFAGTGSVPYAVDHRREPLNAYGRSKAQGEALVEDSGCDHLLIRTSWLYAPWAKNFVRTIARLSAHRPSLPVVSDQRGRPTSALHLAQCSLALWQRGCRGIFHVTDGGECSWYEFAAEIVARTGAACQVEPCTTAAFPLPAPRPTFSVLDVSRTEAELGPLPSWQQNVARVLSELEPL